MASCKLIKIGIVMLCCLTALSHYLNYLLTICYQRCSVASLEGRFTANKISMKALLILHIQIIATSARGQWINSLWPSDTIWRHRSWQILAQVMACCLMAPSHYLSQYWLTITKVQWHSFCEILLEVSQALISKIGFKIIYLKFHSNLPGLNELMTHQFAQQK